MTPPRGFFCHACRDTGVTKRSSGQRGVPADIDACGNCTRNAEMRWLATKGLPVFSAAQPEPLKVAA
jgi:hypothetical protein